MGTPPKVSSNQFPPTTKPRARTTSGPEGSARPVHCHPPEIRAPSPAFVHCRPLVEKSKLACQISGPVPLRIQVMLELSNATVSVAESVVFRRPRLLRGWPPSEEYKPP